MPPATQKTYGKKSFDKGIDYETLLKETEVIVSDQLEAKDVLPGDKYIEEESQKLLEHLGMVEEHEGKYNLTEKGKKMMEAGKEKKLIDDIYSKALEKKYERARA